MNFLVPRVQEGGRAGSSEGENSNKSAMSRVLQSVLRGEIDVERRGLAKLLFKSLSIKAYHISLVTSHIIVKLDSDEFNLTDKK